MPEIRLPLSITYDTTGVTPVASIVEALRATDFLARDAVELLPSLFPGLVVEGATLNVRSITQESPLREAFLIAILATWQGNLTDEVPPMLESIFGVPVGDHYDSLVTVAFLCVAFYGAAMAVDAAKSMFSRSLPREKFEELAERLALETGRPLMDIRRIIEAHFAKPASMRRLITQSKKIFLPSQLDGFSPMTVDRDVIPSETIRQIPLAGAQERETDFNRYTPMEGVEVQLHAKDRDKSATGWAAVIPQIGERRLKVRVVEPLAPSDLWQRDTVNADVVVVSKLTSDGYQPVEVQIAKIF